MKKLLLGIGSVAAIAAPVTFAIACGSNEVDELAISKDLDKEMINGSTLMTKAEKETANKKIDAAKDAAALKTIMGEYKDKLPSLVTTEKDDSFEVALAAISKIAKTWVGSDSVNLTPSQRKTSFLKDDAEKRKNWWTAKAQVKVPFAIETDGTLTVKWSDLSDELQAAYKRKYSRTPVPTSIKFMDVCEVGNEDMIPEPFLFVNGNSSFDIRMLTLYSYPRELVTGKELTKDELLGIIKKIDFSKIDSIMPKNLKRSSADREKQIDDALKAQH